jgi:hypothetical protein
VLLSLIIKTLVLIDLLLRTDSLFIDGFQIEIAKLRRPSQAGPGAGGPQSGGTFIECMWVFFYHLSLNLLGLLSFIRHQSQSGPAVGGASTTTKTTTAAAAEVRVTFNDHS